METLCKKCILPKNYAGINFNDQGTCNLCENNKPLQYRGEDKLKEDISMILKGRKNENYDCVIGFSGGRDSTYLLWYIVNILKLKPLAVFVDSNLIPEETLKNVKKSVEILGVDLVVRKHDYLQSTIKHHLKSWLNYPSAATLITLCCGCRLGISKFINEEAVNNKISIVFTGGTPFEKGLFKRNLISLDGFNNFSFLAGYGKEILKNPSIILNFNSLKIQINEFAETDLSKKKKKSYVPMAPFFNYIRWDEKKIEETIEKELKWRRLMGVNSSYRADCQIGFIRQYFYNRLLGYNDKDDHLSWLIRDKQITRDEAIIRINKEKEVSLEILRYSFASLGFDFDDYNSKFEKNARKHNIKVFG